MDMNSVSTLYSAGLTEYFGLSYYGEAPSNVAVCGEGGGGGL